MSAAALPGEFYDTLGAIQESVGQTRDAEQSYLDGLKKSPKSPVLNFHFGKLIAGDRSRAGKARAHLNKALDAGNRLSPPMKRRGRAPGRAPRPPERQPVNRVAAPLRCRSTVLVRSGAVPGVVLIDPVELRGGIPAEVLFGIRCVLRVLPEVALPLPPTPLTARALDLRFNCLNSRLVGFHGLALRITGFLEVTIEPGDKIQSVPRRVGFEFQGVVPLGIFDHLPVGRGQPSKVSERSFIVDDPILAGQHQQGRLVDPGGCSRDQPIDEEAGGQQPGRRLRGG